MKRDKTGKFTQVWKGESKQAVKLSLTSTAWQLLKQQSRELGISRSELIERYARQAQYCSCTDTFTDTFTDKGIDPEIDFSNRTHYAQQRLEALRSQKQQLRQTLHQAQEQQTAPPIHERQWLEALLNLLPTPMILVDPEQRQVIFSNQAANAIAGVDIAKDVGATYNANYYCTDETGQVIPPEQLPAVRAAQGEKISGVEMCWHTPVGVFPLLVDADLLPATNSYPPISIVVFQNISKLKQTELNLRAAEERLSLVLQATNDAIYDRNLKTDSVWWNPAYDQLVGRRPPERNSSQWWIERLYPDDRARVLASFKDALARADERWTAEYRYRRADGSYAHVIDRTFILRNAAGVPERYLGAISDITPLKQLHQAEQEARSQAEAANRIKDEFLAVLSHELRTPMNPILGWAKLLRQGRLDPHKTAIALETIERNAQLQVQLIEDLLDISRILQGKLSLTLHPINLATTITAAIETVYLDVSAKEIQIQTQIAAEVGLVLGDAARLQQVVWNLLSNAVKFTPRRGQINIHLTAAQGYAQLQIQDTGKGIPANFLPFVFDTFRQADSSITRSFGGLGLGLAIAHHIVKLHQGTIQAESAGEGQGATFTVQLPLKISPTGVKEKMVEKTMVKEIAAEKTMVKEITATEITATEITLQQETTLTHPTLALQGIQVLAVDDEIDNLELSAFILETAGASVVAVSSVPEALQVLPQTKPDILLLDIGMPETDGYMLLQQIRTLEAKQGDRPVPAIALTAYAGEADQQRAIAAGFQQHIPKPVEPEVLLQAVLSLTGS